MTEENKDQDQEVGVIELIIKYDTSNNKLAVQGPMSNGVMFFGMLEMAKVSFLEARMTPSPIMAPDDFAATFGQRNKG